jgi:hypothetical protein
MAFLVDTTDARTFDIWENAFVLSSDSPRQALEDAISTSRAIFDKSDNWRALGYSSKPSLYAVKSLNTEVELSVSNTGRDHTCMILTKISTFSEGEMERVRLVEELLVPYRVIHIG